MSADVTQIEILLNLLLVPSTGCFLHGNSGPERGNMINVAKEVADILFGNRIFIQSYSLSLSLLAKCHLKVWLERFV